MRIIRNFFFAIKVQPYTKNINWFFGTLTTFTIVVYRHNDNTEDSNHHWSHKHNEIKIDIILYPCENAHSTEHHVDYQPTHRTHQLHSRARFINSRWRNLTHCISEFFYYIVSSKALRTDARLIFYEIACHIYAIPPNYRQK